MKHIMLDLETLGTIPGSSLLSIGAVQFDLDGNTGTTFHQTISTASCREIGLVEDPRTIEWWSKQSKEAQDRVKANPQPVTAVISAFSMWFMKSGGEFIWGNGSTFDVVLIEAVYRRLGISTPWKFWNVRDVRTALHLFDFDIREMNRTGVHHDALDDAKFQVSCVAKAIKPIRGAKIEKSVFG